MRVGGAPSAFFQGAEESGEAKIECAEVIQTRVRGPQPGKRLPHTS